MVMATGIVSIAAHVMGMRPVALALFWLNVGLYLVLWVLYLARLVLHAERFVADLNTTTGASGSSRRSPGRASWAISSS